jgi:hypothetical protein
MTRSDFHWAPSGDFEMAIDARRSSGIGLIANLLAVTVGLVIPWLPRDRGAVVALNDPRGRRGLLGWGRTLALPAVLLTLVVVGGICPLDAGAVTTLARTRHAITAFAFEGDHVAWDTGPCVGGSVDTPFVVMRLSTGTRRAFPQAGPFCIERMALSDRRVVWEEFTDTEELTIQTQAIGGTTRVALEDDDLRGTIGQRRGPMAGAPTVLVYSLGPGRDAISGELQYPGGVWRVIGGTAQRLAGTPAARRLAVTSTHMCMAPRFAPVGTVQVRDPQSGAAISSFVATGPVLAVATAGNTVAALVRSASGAKHVETHDATTGALLNTREVSPLTVRALDMSPAGVLFATSAGALRLIDMATGDRRTIRVGRPLKAFGIEGKRIIWAFNRPRGGGVIRTTHL